ncbi:MAG: NnrU family protein [Pseudomonadota bacterium]
MDWLPFGVAFIAFFATHSIPVRPAVKSRLVAVLGPRGFSLAYSSLSLVMLAMLIVVADSAPYVAVWDQALWQRHAVLYGMLAVCLVAALAIGRPNPFSFGGAKNHRFDPARPGVIRWSRHPLLWCLAFWALLHLLPNGDLAHAILFGVFAGFSFLGMVLIDRRKRREFGHTAWRDLQHAVQAGPILPQPISWQGAVVRSVAGLLVFLLLLGLHPAALGVSPLP